MNRDQRKFLKRKKRERRLAEQEQSRQAHLDYKRKYPTFSLIDTDQANSIFVNKITAIVRDIDFDSFPFKVKDFLVRCKEDRDFLIGMAQHSIHPVAQALFNWIGEYIYNALGESIKTWIPYNDIRVLPIGREIVIQFNSLKKTSGPGGTVYYSPRKPTVEFVGKEYTVAFSTML